MKRMTFGLLVILTGCPLVPKDLALLERGQLVRVTAVRPVGRGEGFLTVPALKPCRAHERCEVTR